MIKELCKNLLKRFNKWKVKRGLIYHNLYMLEMETCLEQWVSYVILNVNLNDQEKQAERTELLKKGQAIKRIELFLEWLKGYK